MHYPLTPLRFLERASSVHPDRTAIVDGTRSFTYAAMAAQVTRLARALRPGVCGRAIGWPTSRRTAPRCSSPTSPCRWPAACWSPSTPGCRPRRSPRSSSIPGPTYCSPTPRCWSRRCEKLAAVTTLREIVILPAEDGDPVEVAATTTTTTCSPPAATNRLPYAVADEDDPISLNYTSGTTGDPKGVVYTHRGAYLNSLGEVIHQGFATVPAICGRCRCSTATAGAPPGR